MKDNIKNGCTMGAMMSMAFVWMSTMFGGGWATGMNSFVYGTHAGYPGIIAQLVGMAGIAAIGWVTIEFSRMAEVWNYRTFMDAIYRTKIAGTLYDITQLVCVPISLGACVSTFASCMEVNFGANYWLCVIIFAVIILVCTMWGNEVLGKIGSYMGTAIIILLVVTFGFVAAKRGYVFTDMVAAGTVLTSWDDAWYWGVIRFMMLSGGMCLSIIPIFKPIKTRRDTTITCLIGWLLCSLFIVFIGFVVITGLPDGGAESSVPYLFALQQLNIPWLNFVYVAIVALAVITTGNTMLFAYQCRYCDLKFVKKMQAKESTKMLVIGIILVGLSVGVSAFGLQAIVAKGYGYMSYLTTPFCTVGIPVMGVIHLYLIKKRKIGIERGSLVRYWEAKAAEKAKK